MPAVAAAGRRRMTRAERKAQLLHVAERMIAQHGVLATSMDNVAEAAGVTKPVLYDHFRSKDGLLCALIARAGDELYEHTTSAVVSAATDKEMLERGLRAYFETLDRRDGVWWALLDATAAVSPATMAELDRIRDRQAGFIAALVAENRIAPDPRRALVYAHAVTGACERLAALRAEHRDLGVEEVTHHLLELLWSGLAAAGDGHHAAD